MQILQNKALVYELFHCQVPLHRAILAAGSNHICRAEDIHVIIPRWQQTLFWLTEQRHKVTWKICGEHLAEESRHVFNLVSTVLNLNLPVYPCCCWDVVASTIVEEKTLLEAPRLEVLSVFPHCCWLFSLNSCQVIASSCRSTCLFHLLVALLNICADGGTGFCHKPNMTLHDANAWFMQYNAAVHRMFLQQNAKCIQFHCHIRHTSMDVEARKASAQERANPSNLPCFAGHVWMESGIMAGLIGMASFPL